MKQIQPSQPTMEPQLCLTSMDAVSKSLLSMLDAGALPPNTNGGHLAQDCRQLIQRTTRLLHDAKLVRAKIVDGSFKQTSATQTLAAQRTVRKRPHPPSLRRTQSAPAWPRRPAKRARLTMRPSAPARKKDVQATPMDDDAATGGWQTGDVTLPLRLGIS